MRSVKFPLAAFPPVGPAILLCMCLLASHASRASGQDDQERARLALEAGELLPLPVLLDRVGREHPGQVMEVELESESGRWIYEMKLLDKGGSLIKLKLDAKDGTLIKSKRKHGPDAEAVPAAGAAVGAELR